MTEQPTTPSPFPQRMLSFLGSLQGAFWLMGSLAVLWVIGLRWAIPGLRGALWAGMALLSLGALVAILQRRTFTWVRLGFLMVHLAPAVFLAGALWNRAAGHRDEIPLSMVRDTDSQALPEIRFRLESLQRKPAPVELQLLAFRSAAKPGAFEGEGQVFPLKEGLKGRIEGTDWRFQVERLMWDALDQGHFAESPEFERDPMLQVVLGVGRPEPLAGHLFARNALGCRQEEPEGRFSVVFKERFTPDLLGSLRPKGPRAERLRADLPGQSLAETVQEGRSWRAGAFTVRMLRVFPDFEVLKDRDGNPQPGTRSQTPRDPWLQVEVDPGDGRYRRLLLSARNPQQTDRLNAPHLPEGWRFRYEREGEELQRRFVLFTQEDRQIRLIEQGRVVRGAGMDLGRPFVITPGLSVTPVALLERPRYLADFAPNPEALPPGQAERSVLRLQITDPETGRAEAQWLEVGGGPVPFFDARLAFIARPRFAPDRLEGRLRIAGPRTGLTTSVRLSSDASVTWQGWRLSLGEEPGQGSRRVILGLTREPGRPLIGVSLALLFVGGVWMFWMKPWLKRRAAAERGGA